MTSADATVDLVQRTLLTVFSLLIATGLLNERSSAASQSDTQFWSEIDATKHFTPTTSVTLVGAMRIGEGLPNPTLSGGGLQMDYAKAAWMLSAGGLVLRIRNSASGKATGAQLAFFALSYLATLFGMTLSDRNGLEQIDGVPCSPTRYRNRLMIEYPIRGAGPISHLFLSEEAFYSIKDFQWTRNRIQAGRGIPLRGPIDLQFYYLGRATGLARSGR